VDAVLHFGQKIRWEVRETAKGFLLKNTELKIRQTNVNPNFFGGLAKNSLKELGFFKFEEQSYYFGQLT